jgi:hypothetical protein
MGRAPTTHTAVVNQTLSKYNADDSSKQDFLLFCLPNAADDDLIETVHALYYLPENFKIVVVGDSSLQDSEMMPWADKAIMNRIHFTDQAGLSDEETTSPFLYIGADAHETGKQSVFEKTFAPHVVLSSSEDNNGLISDHNHGYRVALGNPEALASAILRISRAGA